MSRRCGLGCSVWATWHASRARTGRGQPHNLAEKESSDYREPNGLLLVRTGRSREWVFVSAADSGAAHKINHPPVRCSHYLDSLARFDRADRQNSSDAEEFSTS